MKVIHIGMIFLLLFFTLASAVFAEEITPRMELILQNDKVQENSKTNLSVKLRGFEGSSSNLVAAEIKISFDPKLVQLDKLTLGDVLEGLEKDKDFFEGIRRIDNVNGILHYSFNIKPDIRTFSGSGTMFQVEVHALKAGTAHFEVLESYAVQSGKPGINMDHESVGTSLTITASGGGTTPPKDDQPSDSKPTPSPQGDTGEQKEELDLNILSKYTDREDIELLEWAKVAIAYLTQLGILKGDENGNFRPNDLITREEFASMMSRVLDLHMTTSGATGMQLDDQTNPVYEDVKEQNWSYPYIEKVTQYGLMNGYKVGDQVFFYPTKPIARGEIAAVLVRYLGLNETTLETLDHPFTDIEHYWGKTNVILAYQQGIINGKTPTTFDPEGNATRAEAATMIYRALMKGGNTSISIDELQ